MESVDRVDAAAISTYDGQTKQYYYTSFCLSTLPTYQSGVCVVLAGCIGRVKP